jgi:hypothetical protein
VPQLRLLLASHDHQLEDATLNPLHLFDYLLGDHLELGVQRVSLGLDAVARQMRHEAQQVDGFLLLDRYRSQFDLHDEDVQPVAALLFRNDANHL